MEDLASLPEMDGPYDTSADAFYEEIEAPKFVDLTDKNPIHVDDRYWFCSRVGCDQKHEEELDSEEVYKNFILRVMAARSPNVRLHKALSRRCSSKTNAKCPQSAPPKSTRPPVSRLAIVSSSMATRIDNLKSKCKEQRTQTSVTPNAKVKVVGAKYMTTPRNKNLEPKHDSFRSVQNPKQGQVHVGEVKSRVAKALVFNSPKKTVKLKASLELKTPVRKICDKLKKLELDEESRKKKVLGYSPKTKSSASKPKANIIRPWRVDGTNKAKKVGLAENKKPKSNDISLPCDSPDENQVAEIIEQVGEQEVLHDAKAAAEQQSEDARSGGRKVPTSEKTSNKFLKERGILKEANSGTKDRSAGKCQGDVASESESKPARTMKPSSTRTSTLEHSKAITAAKMASRTPEKPKSILVSSTKRKTATSNRENIVGKRTVSFVLPGEKTPEVSSATENPKKVSIMKSPGMAKKNPTSKNSSSAWRLP